MRIVALYFLFLLCALADMACWLLRLACESLAEGLLKRCSLHMDKAKRNLIAKYNGYAAIQEKTKKAEFKDAPPMRCEPANVVGGSKTSFMKELPALKKPETEEIKPFKSEPLEMFVGGQDDFDAAPDSFDIENAPVGPEDEIDEFGYGGEDMNNASGISFEELTETIGILSGKNPSDDEKEKAASVLDAINNTELFQFITINNAVYENAKMLMSV